MDSSEMFSVVDALDTVAGITGSSVEKIVDALTGLAFDEETAGELKFYHREKY